MENYFEASKKARKEASIWAYAAWTLPFVALALIVFEYYIGSNDLLHKIIVAITVTFFGISVYWWWWALHKFVMLLEAFKETEINFKSIQQELRKTRETISNVGNRKR